MSLSDNLAAGKSVVLEHLPSSGLAYLLARLPNAPPLVIVAASDQRCQDLVADLRAFGVGDVVRFGIEAPPPFAAAAPAAESAFEQSVVRHRLIWGERPRVVVVPATALLSRWMPNAAFVNATALWSVSESVGLERLVGQLVRCGYNRVNVVEDVGTFAVRGSIVDVFTPDHASPLRIDLFGDDISSIKAFDAQSQRTTANLEVVALHPIRELVFDAETRTRAATVLNSLAETSAIPTRRLRSMAAEVEAGNYFFGVESLWPLFYEGSAWVAEALLDAKTLLVLDDAPEIETQLQSHWQTAAAEKERAEARHELTLPLDQLLVPPEQALADLHARAAVRTTRLAVGGETPLHVDLTDLHPLAFELEQRRHAGHSELLEPLARALHGFIEQRHEVFVTCSTRGNAERLAELLRPRQLDLPIQAALPEAASLGSARRQPRAWIVTTPLSGGFHDGHHGVAVISDVEIFGIAPKRQPRRRPPAEGLSTLRDLVEGDLIVHVDHGIGRYLGLKRLVLEGAEQDYAQLEYADSDKLYLPIYHLNLLQRFAGSSTAKLDKLGGIRWEKAKAKVRDAVLALAHQLLALQARRHARAGFRLPDPDDHFRSFEATFPFEETPDQHKAIDDVLADLTKDTPMDRLVCGDVGFGKTEVAIRAAYLAVLGGRQVAVLVPTTVLAEQHGMTFGERLAPFGVTVEVLSRFRSPKEAHDVLGRAREGKLDILVGTHRLLSHDVVFRNLGLLVVDEEHRFGVRHKERIKELRAQVHVLTLTATPIPRTMHMATVGLRDLSIIQTPPTERTSVRTEVTRFDEELIQDAMRRELHRGGQVFVVHNRIRSIDAMARLLGELVPEASIAVAHGQMSGDKLEPIMVNFARRETNVLLCTAIIESGIDIPSANTMIINRADTFGLAQLHQLRGRIGRGHERAFAYLLLPRSDRITAEARERLSVLKRFSDLGAGFHIATQDLDIRGAGNLLGSEQSGHIASVGFQLYTELLAEAVERAKGERTEHTVEPDIKLAVSAVLPESYIQPAVERLDYYQRMATAVADTAIFDLVGELEDLYGAPPDEVHHLAEVMVIRRRLKELGATSLAGAIKDGAIRLGLTFLPDAAIDRNALAVLLQKQPDNYKLLPSGRLSITLATLQGTTPLHFLQRVRQELGGLPRAAR